MSRKNQLPKNIYHASLEEEAIYFKNIVLSNNERKALLELTALKIQGNIKYENIVNTIIGVMKKTPIARCSFQILNDTLIKKDNLNIALNNLISFYDLSDLSEKKQDEKYNNILNKTFDISKKVFDFVCLKYHSRKHVLIVRAHHIASDHVTSMKLLHDFFDTYNEILIKGERCKITKYSNEEVSCSLVRKESALNDTEPTKYWKNVFRKTLYLSEFKPDLPYPEEGSGNGGLVNFKIGETSLLKKHSKKNRITPFIFLLGVLNTFMYQRNRAKHCCLSIALSTRDKSTKNISGCFINSLPLIVEPNENESFKCFLKKIKSEIKNLQKYKQYPFSEVNKLFSNIGKLPYHPLQRVFTTYTYTGKLEKVIENVKLSYLPIRSFGTNGSDMSIVFIDDGKCIHADLNYNKDIFHKDTINNFIEGFKTVLNHVLDDDTKKLKNINIVSEKEKHWLLDECNNTKKDYPREKTIHRVFEEKVKNTPNAIAVVYKDKEIAYKELNEEANKLANYLIQQGVEVEDLIGICVDRSIEMVVGLLAVLKAGAAYVPIDPTYPKDRINYMIKDSKASFILTQMHLKEFLVNVKSAIIFLDRINLKDFSIKNPKVNMSSRNLAYVIFTSGSTGKPKGVMVEHRSVLNLVLNQKYINLKCPKIMQLSTISFDASIFEIYYTLLNNGSLILYPHADIEFRILNNFLSKYKIDVLWLTAAFFDKWAYTLKKDDICFLKTILTGGEVVNSLTVEYLRNKFSSLSVVDGYGPTENTTFTTTYTVKQDTPKNIPIGKPINNTQIYLLDDNLNLVPRSVVGELCISGDGLARGYLNNSKLTSQKFVDNPYLEGERLYKTGDLAKYLEDGNIEYVGRVDEQVKIRGFRIELGEIEQKLLSISNFKEGCVIVKNDEVLGKMLVAYVTVINNQDIDSKEVIFHLERILPRHMIPSVVIKLKEMPLTLNGKIDKKYLSELDVTFISSEEYIEPQTNTQERLVKLFQEILDVDRVGIKDNFFDLGGHSLLATQLISKINREFNVQFQLKLLFELGNINLISRKLDSLGKESEKEYSLIPIEKHTNKAPLSYAQERLWFSFQEDPESIKYNMPILVDFKGVFSVSKIKDAFVKIVNRHEILRTAFVEGKKGIFQKVLNKIEFDIKIFDLTRVKSLSEADIKKTYYAEVIRCFDLRKNPPFFNVSYVKVSKKRSILLLNMHHIIADEESVKIILKELNGVLNLKKLHPIKVQYSDYSAWEKSVFEKQKLKESLVFLEKEFNPFPRKMNLKNLHKTLTKKTKFNILTNKIALNTLPNLREIQKKHNVTITHLLLSVYAILLYRYTAQSSILIVMPVSNREGNELQSTVGFFVDMILIKIDIDYSDDFLTVLNQVKNKVISGAGNQRVPLQILIENLRRQYPDLSSNNIQCAFNSTRINTEGTINHVDYQISSVNSTEGKVPLTLTANTSGTDLLIQCEYSGDFCNKEMKRFVDNFVSILTKLENSKTPIMLFDIFNNRIQKLNSLSKNITPLTQIQKDLYLEGEVSFNGQYLIGGYFFTEGSYQVEVIKKIINFIFKKIKFQNLRICKYFDELYMYETKNDGRDLIYEFEINDLGNIEEELYENAQKIISLSDSSLIRPILIYKENKLLAISLMAHHVIVDAISLVQISILHYPKTSNNFLNFLI